MEDYPKRAIPRCFYCWSPSCFNLYSLFFNGLLHLRSSLPDRDMLDKLEEIIGSLDMTTKDIESALNYIQNPEGGEEIEEDSATMSLNMAICITLTNTMRRHQDEFLRRLFFYFIYCNHFSNVHEFRSFVCYFCLYGKFSNHRISLGFSKWILIMKQKINKLTPHDLEPLVSPRQVADALGVRLDTVQGWYKEGKCPPPDVRGHRFVRWKISSIREFLNDPVAWREQNL